MTLKTVSLVVGVLAAASVAVHLATRPAPSMVSDARVGAALLPAEKAEKAACLVVSDQGRSVTLQRHSDGLWVVQDYHGFPADFRKLSQLVEELMRAKVDRLVSSNPERISQFGFKDTRVIVKDAEGRVLWELDLGRQTETGGRLLRFGSEEKAYQARLNAWLDAEPKGWADTQLVGLRPEEVCHLELGFPGGARLAFVRDKKEDPFRLDPGSVGRQADSSKVTALLSSLTGLRYSEVVAVDDPQAREAAAHARTCKIVCFDGRSLEVVLARRPEQKVPKVLASANQLEAGATASLAAAAQALQSPGASPEPAKPAADIAKEESIPAGPVFVRVSSSDSKAPVNMMMNAFAFQTYEYSFTGLPSKPEDMLQPEAAKP